MITYDRDDNDNRITEKVFSFKGLSTDSKPTETHDDKKILNGSTFLEMDTQDLKFYDESGKRWV